MKKIAYSIIMTFMIMSIVCCNQNKQVTRNEEKSGTTDMSDSLIDDTIALMRFYRISTIVRF